MHRSSSSSSIDATAGLFSRETFAQRIAKSRVLRGSLLALLGYGGSQVLRLVGNLVLWRLLYAEAFGLMAIVNVFMQGLSMFSDVGIGPSIIQNEKGDDPDYLDTAWTIQALRGGALFLVAIGLSVPVARFYQQASLAPLIAVVGAGAALSGFYSTKLFTVTRHMALGRLTAIDLASQATGLFAMIAWALASRSIWSLVVGGLVSQAVRLVLGHTLLPGRTNRFRWHKTSVHALVTFGRWIFLSTLLTFAAMQSDRLIFGKLTTMSMLGVYSIATIWATFPTQILSHVLQSVMFPMLSRLHNDRTNIAAAYRAARTPWLFATGFLTACLVSGGPALIRFLYDERAQEASWITQILAIGCWFLALEMTNGAALLATGRPRWIALGSFAKLAGMVVLIPLGMAVYGFRGAVVGFTASELFRYAVSAWGAARSKLGGSRQDLALSFLVLSTSALGLLVGAVIRGLDREAVWSSVRTSALVEGSTLLIVLAVAWAAAFAVYRRSSLVATS